MTLYQTQFYAYGNICMTTLWQMATSESDAISRVPNFKIIGNFVQTSMSAK